MKALVWPILMTATLLVWTAGCESEHEPGPGTEMPGGAGPADEGTVPPAEYPAPSDSEPEYPAQSGSEPDSSAKPGAASDFPARPGEPPGSPEQPSEGSGFPGQLSVESEFPTQPELTPDQDLTPGSGD